MVNEKFNTRMTFMDIRIMASELEVDEYALENRAKIEAFRRAASRIG